MKTQGAFTPPLGRGSNNSPVDHEDVVVFSVSCPDYWSTTIHEFDAEPFQVGDVIIQPIPLIHGKWPILGWRIGNAAYLTDVSEIPDESCALLHDLDVLFLDCLRTQPHPTHLSVAQSMQVAAQIGAKRTVLIHMTHELEFHTLSASLPAGVEVGYDGLRIAIE